MVFGPEMARVIGEFKGSIQRKQDMDYRHHEQTTFTRVDYFLSTTIEVTGNPFSESSSDCLVLNSRYIADSAVADTVF